MSVLTDVGDSTLRRLARLLSSFCTSSCLGSHLYVSLAWSLDSELLLTNQNQNIVIPWPVVRVTKQDTFTNPLRALWHIGIMYTIYVYVKQQISADKQFLTIPYLSFPDSPLFSDCKKAET